ncbi:tRNA-dihydrouridine(16/17) synthase [NAD(P)(+)] [Neolecta irregularis DAH-3]|uniref:tRNA-dihydrouridine(16/17) synthase [NAD(P)(+)] n=1 Tax=Neolecta irregularis (strain DAH-3) TaxID=1198029 RepID=A0A1U7LKG8_NEOID|nr:tRNA-dihydrouridine(16/17) synthase [NAD(P)(+)] [Neolecta irregularis DAH-3]|eukprot:OLL23150.1 tRNA-dihydrouridine(16/17) synthase [NAD(P)(+)] [Neolecta irregularis DAH-3]
MSPATKLTGREFYERLGCPKKIVAPMVDQSELTRLGGFYRDAMEGKCALRLCSMRAYSARKGSREKNIVGKSGPLKETQFCANDPKDFLAAAKIVEGDCDAVDLNLGCPQGIARKGRYGSFLQDDWELISTLISTAHKNLLIPVTTKIRVFPDREKTLQYAKMILDAGAAFLSVHGRTREQKGQFCGIADWEIIRFLKERLGEHVVVFANGNILHSEDVQECLKKTQADGVMSAEANLSNPAIFVSSERKEDRYPRVDSMARAYLDILTELDDPGSMSGIKAHLFHLLRPAFSQTMNIDLRNRLGKTPGREISLYYGIIDILSQRIDEVLKDSEVWDEEEKDEMGYLKIPWWRCQSYVRPLRERPRKGEDMLPDKKVKVM